MNRIINLLIVFLLLLTTGCSKERLSSPGDDFEQKGSASLSLSFVRYGGTSDLLGESTLNTVRIIAFASNSNGSDLNAPVLNKLYVGSGTDRISINEIVPAGYLNIYLVGNELASDNDRFSNITSIDNLKALMWDYNANSEYLVPAFPMFSAYKRIRINVNGEIEGMAPNSGTSNEYTFHIERAVAKVEVKVNCNFADDLAGVKILLDKAAVKQLPYESYPFAREYDGPEDDYFDLSEINLEEGTHLTTDDEGFEISDGKLVFYVPEHLTSQSKKYTYLELSGSLIQNPGMRVTYKVPLGDGLSFYSPKQLIEDHASIAAESYYLCRNNHYILSLNIKSLGDMEGVFVNQMVKPWQTVDIDGSSAAPYLNVSTVSTNIIDYATQRVYFWTNQKDIELESFGKLESTTGDYFTVSDVFDNLVGAGATNFSFTYDDVTRIGTGYFDLITTKSNYNQKCLLYLNANMLRREIAVNIVNAADIIYFKDGKIEVGKWGFDIHNLNDISLFQFGSVIARSYGHTGAANYNPTNNAALSTMNGSWTYGEADVEHTATGLAAGKGDPCRLAGYTQEYIKSEIAAGRVPDNGKWRLPTYDDNVTFGTGFKTAQVQGINGAYLSNQFIPFSGAGYYTTGEFFGQNNDGYYWSGTLNGDKAYMLYVGPGNFDSKTHNTRQAYGFSVRCVKSEPVAPRIYVEPNGGDPILEITTNATNYGALFQFGSVIAWNYENTGTLAADANYNPTVEFGNIGWRSSISSPVTDTYHTDVAETIRATNMRTNGYGDPCRLVGFTLSHIKTEIAAGRVPDNGKWRLPTNAENGTFGATSSAWTSLQGVNGYYLSNQFLPAAGYRRSITGDYLEQNITGLYWSSSKYGSNGYVIRIDSEIVRPAGTNNQPSAFSVRCVPQNP